MSLSVHDRGFFAFFIYDVALGGASCLGSLPRLEIVVSESVPHAGNRCDGRPVLTVLNVWYNKGAALHSFTCEDPILRLSFTSFFSNHLPSQLQGMDALRLALFLWPSCRSFGTYRCLMKRETILSSRQLVMILAVNRHHFLVDR